MRNEGKQSILGIALDIRFLTVKEGSTFHLGLLPSGKKRETALLGAQNRYALRWRTIKSLRHVVRDGPPGNSSL